MTQATFESPQYLLEFNLDMVILWKITLLHQPPQPLREGRRFFAIGLAAELVEYQSDLKRHCAL